MRAASQESVSAFKPYHPTQKAHLIYPTRESSESRLQNSKFRADVRHMATMIYSLVTVILFCASSAILMHEAQKNIPIVNQSSFSKKALRIGKTYKVMSWSVMTLFFFVTVIFSFTEVLTQL